MESKKNIIAYLRQKQGLTQEELAEKLFVTRQAVSRWETGETTPQCGYFAAAFHAVRCIGQCAFNPSF